MPVWMDPVDVTPGTTGSWQDVDVSSYVPEGCPGVLLRCVNKSGGNRQMAVRKNGSTSSPTTWIYYQMWAVAGLDSSRIFEAYVSGSSCYIYLLGYFTSGEVVLVTNTINKSPGSAGWQDVNISGEVGTDPGLGGIFFMSAGSNYAVGIRKDGSTDNRTAGQCFNGAYWMIGLANKICEVYRASTAVSVSYVGHINSNATFYTNATDYSLSSTESYVDLAALPSGAAAGIFEIHRTAGAGGTADLRKKGNTIDNYYGIQGHIGAWVEGDSSRVIEGKISGTDVDFWLLGYFPPPFTVWQYTGDVTLTVQPESGIKSVMTCSGDITIALEPQSDYEKPGTWSYDGSLEIAVLPESGYGPARGWTYAGDIGLAMTLESLLAVTRAYQGDIVVAITPESVELPAWTRQYDLVNALQVWVDKALVNALALERDFALVNRVGTVVTRDFDLVNAIKEAVTRNFDLVNALESSSPIIRDIAIRNVLLPETTARILTPTWDVALSGTSIKDSVIAATITMDDGSFTNEAELTFAGLDVLEDLEAVKGSGKDELVVTIQGKTFKFLVEEIELAQDLNQTGIRVWGRSKTAILADPQYTDPITKVWEENVLASAIIEELAPGFMIQNSLEDWVIPARELSAEQQMPLDLIRRLAEVQGGIVRSGPQGELVIRPRYPVSPAALPDATPDATFYETDDLLALGDRREPWQGWNAVTVEGKSTSADEPSLKIELDDERNAGRTTFAPGEDVYLRVYPRPFDLSYTHQITLGEAVLLGTYEQIITDEEIQVSDGVASTDYPILSVDDIDFDGRELSDPSWEVGGQEIKFNVAEGCSGSGFIRLDYRTQYDLWRVTADEAGTAIFCIEDEDEA